MKYETGLIIGRFQPFHQGHLYLFQEAFKQVENVIIGVGSINVNDDKNPFSYAEVEKMIDVVLQKEGWADRVTQIFGVPDFHNDDEKWVAFIDKQSQPFDVVMSHNNWVTDIFQSNNIPVITIPFYRRDVYEGLQIRSLLKRRAPWQNRVPSYLVPLITQKVDS